MSIVMAFEILPMGRCIRLAARQGIDETSQQFFQASAYLPAGMAAHVAPREKQQVDPWGATEPVREHVSREAADAAARRGAAGGSSQRHD
jgi:hypothetical protein